ncbi:DUF1735 domain-containing protein [Sphingobacterium endophyticum]|uniref:DUF1735 domain-containing protein n=1 Tax=Sphingobacterium endophyticum TaxID=2546448 RepID=UPI0018CF8B59|nr:DUF1735 domain-containing protein [Sphingobacterium endophyticum]
MKKLLNQCMRLFCLMLFVWTFSSCEDTMLNNMVDDRVYLLKPGLNEVQVYNFDRAIAEVVVVKSGVGQRSSQLKLEISPSVLSAYNTANGTTYRALPQAVYSLSNPNLQLAAEDIKASFEFVIDHGKFVAEQAKDPEATLVIPCQVVNLNPAEGDSVNMQTIVIPRIIEPYIFFTKAGFLTEVNNISSKSQEKLFYDNKIEVNYPASQDVEYTLAIAKNSAELIQQYNAENASDYVILPSGALELQGTSKIPVGVNYADYKFQVVRSKLVGANNSPKYGRYLLPLVIHEVSQNKIHPTDNVVLIPFNYHE